MKSRILLLWFTTLMMAVAAGAQGNAAGTTSATGGNAALTGTISDQTGTGVAGVTVTADDGAGVTKTATTDGQGLYATELPAGTYNLSVSAKGVTIFQGKVVLSASQVLTFGLGGPIVAVGPQAVAPSPASPAGKAAIIGTVSDQAGVPVSGATIAVDNGAGFSQSATTDAQGLYAAELPSGSYNVSVSANGAKVFLASVILGPGQAVTVGVAGALVAQAPVSGNPNTAAAAATVSPAPAAAVPQSTPPSPAAVPSGNGSSLSGNITDQTGAVLVGATIKLTTGSEVAATTASDDKGNYSIAGLKPGSYTLTVSQPGFKDFVATNINLGAGVQLPLDAALEPASEKTQVNVVGESVGRVETETAEVSGTITQKEVTTLGLNGRNFTQLIALTPGVSNQTGQDEAKVGVVGSVKYSVNGGRVEYNTFEVDGSDVLNAGLNGAESTLVVYPSLDAIQEVKVLTSNYGAMYGRTASGTVLVTTKSGGAQWHGDAYEFIRNEAFNARNYFDQTTKAPKYRRNDFGFTLGGPIRKGKTFIFFSEEFRYEDSPSDQHPDFNHGVPSLAERSGDFSDVCPPTPGGGQVNFLRSNWPDCPNVVPGGNIAGYDLTFPNNNVFSQAGGFGESNTAAALMATNLIPLPNASSGCNSSIGSCYDAVISEPTRWREELVSLDQNFGTKLRLSLHGIYDNWSTTVPVPQWPLDNVANSFPTVQNKFVGPGTSVVAHLTHTINATLLNEIEASFINSHITLNDVNGPGGANFQRPTALQTPGSACPSTPIGPPDCALGAIFNNGFGGKAPGIFIGGNNQEYGGSGFSVDPSYMPFIHTNPTYSFRENLSKSIGPHTIQGGVQAILAQRSETNPAIGAASGDVQGLLTFSNVNGGLVNTGNAFANLLYYFGQPQGLYEAIQSFSQDSTQYKYYNRYQILEPYLQDDWKVNSRLNVNLGVRFSLFGLWNEKYHQAYNWNPANYNPALAAQLRVDPITGELLSVPDGAAIPINLTNPDPRIINGIVRCGVSGVPNGCMTGHLFNPAPRIGVAFDPRGDGKTSIRAGYGIFYEHGTGEEANTGSLEASAPNVLSMTQTFPVNYGCVGGASFSSDPLCAQQLPAGPGAYPLSVTSIPTTALWPYSQQWSLSVERQLSSSLVASVAYVGSKGTHLTVERQINQLKPIPVSENPFGPTEPLIPTVPGITPGQSGAGDCGAYSFAGTTNPVFTLINGTTIPQGDPAYYNLVASCAGVNGVLNPTPNVNTLRPYPGLGEVFALQNIADSTYHGLQAVIRRTSGPVTIGASYTYSHSIDDSSDRSDATFVNSYDLRSNRASSNFDERHLLNVSYIYTLPNLSRVLQNWTTGRPGQPTGEGQDEPSPSAPSRFLRLLGDGWQISGITVFQSGTPFSVINEAGSSVSVLDNAGVANGVGAGSYPDVNPYPGSRPSQLNNTKSFGPLLGNPNLFVAPRGLTFGNAGRNFLSNPHRTNFDMSMLKHFQVREGQVLEFRAEAFNLFNHTQFRLYNADLGNTGSNSISCYGGPDYTAGFQGPIINGVITGTDCVTGSSFLHPVDAHRPRTIQFGLKYSF
ncbi:MAG TPA: carboxypeptidase regulatory-like domain-containing protein [Verrucomicrobiae bacterium]|nr:carboxypeptidase regulatory-like domain-containing protein [Verrucomicrobiae bacterium]